MENADDRLRERTLLRDREIGAGVKHHNMVIKMAPQRKRGTEKNVKPCRGPAPNPY